MKIYQVICYQSDKDQEEVVGSFTTKEKAEQYLKEIKNSDINIKNNSNLNNAHIKTYELDIPLIEYKPYWERYCYVSASIYPNLLLSNSPAIRFRDIRITDEYQKISINVYKHHSLPPYLEEAQEKLLISMTIKPLKDETFDNFKKRAIEILINSCINEFHNNNIASENLIFLNKLIK